MPLLLSSFALAAGLIVAFAFERVYDIQIRVRGADPLAIASGHEPDPSSRAPLPLRLVDSGGVGIPLDNWGDNYSHDRRAFRAAILKDAPYVDAAAFGRIEQDWRAYVTRMHAYAHMALYTQPREAAQAICGVMQCDTIAATSI